MLVETILDRRVVYSWGANKHQNGCAIKWIKFDMTHNQCLVAV